MVNKLFYTLSAWIILGFLAIASEPATKDLARAPDTATNGLGIASETAIKDMALALETAKKGPTIAQKATKKGKTEAPNELSCNDPFILALSNAYITNPQLHAAVRQQYALAESVPKALSGWRPQISVIGTASKSKTITEGTQQPIGVIPFQPTGPKTGIDSMSNTSQASSQLSVQQNLFQGGQTVYGVCQAEYQVLAGEANLLNTEQQILLTSIQLYLDVWKNGKVLEFRQSSEKFQKTLLDQVKAQVDVGEKTITDLAQSEAAYAQAIADRIAAEAQLAATIASYRQTIGLNPPETITPPKVLVGFSCIPKSIEEVKKLAADYYPVVLNALYSERAASAAISVAEGVLLPTLNAQVNGQRTWQQDGNGRNVNKFHQRVNQGNATLTLTIPIYQSGSEWSNLRQVNQTRYQALSTLRQQKLAAIQLAVQTWEAWKAAEEAAHQLEISVKAAAITVEGRRQQYIVGESTLTDVLAAERDLVQSQSNLVQAQRDYMVQGYTLISLYGNLLPATLGLPVCRYDVKAYETNVKWQVAGTGDLRPDIHSY